MTYYSKILLNKSLFDGDSSFKILNASLLIFSDASLNILVISFAFEFIKMFIKDELKFLELTSLIFDKFSKIML